MIFANSYPSALEHRIFGATLETPGTRAISPFAHGVHACSHHAYCSAVFAVGAQSPGFPSATGHSAPSHPAIGIANLHAADRRYSASGTTRRIDTIRFFPIARDFCRDRAPSVTDRASRRVASRVDPRPLGSFPSRVRVSPVARVSRRVVASSPSRASRASFFPRSRRRRRRRRRARTSSVVAARGVAVCGVRDGRDGRDARPETPIEIERSRSNDRAIERSIGARAGGTRRAGRAVS